MAMAGKIKLFSIFMSGVALSLAPMAEAGVSTSAAVIADIFNEEPADKQVDDQFQIYNQTFTRLRGEVELLNGDAKISVPEGFYFLDADQTSKLMEELTGFPAESDVLGMMMADGTDPLDSKGWRLMVRFDDIGRVEADTGDINADATLQEFRSQADRTSLGNASGRGAPIELLGWAAAPELDTDSMSFSWGVDLVDFTRNLDLVDYRVNMLGREGVLKLELVASGFDRDAIHAFGAQMDKLASFNKGARYQDFSADVDKVAQVDIDDYLTLGWAD
ncbi:MAG: hypothetical protein CME89_01425 [Hirschia sp.]|nr:hypothetical protein [Hirschia sp.]